jgi:hypothetical protein
MAIVSLMTGKADPARIRPLDAADPMVGTNCRCVFDESPVREASCRGERERRGHRARSHRDWVLPSFRPRNGVDILRAAIIHYKATNARLQ